MAKRLAAIGAGTRNCGIRNIKMQQCIIHSAPCCRRASQPRSASFECPSSSRGRYQVAPRKLRAGLVNTGRCVPAAKPTAKREIDQTTTNSGHEKTAEKDARC